MFDVLCRSMEEDYQWDPSANYQPFPYSASSSPSLRLSFKNGTRCFETMPCRGNRERNTRVIC
jgi:hypothetical protein